jgi:hypothetical protein
MTVRKFVFGFMGILAGLCVTSYLAFAVNITRLRGFHLSYQPWCRGLTICVSAPSSSPRVSVEEAQRRLENCGCPLLPPVGPASAGRALGAWATATEFPLDVVFWFDTDLFLSYEGGGQQASAFIERSEQFLEEGGWEGSGFMVSLRGTRGIGTEPDGSEPSVLAWVEGGYHVLLNGYIGQSVSDLIEIAESMPVAGPSPAS